MKVDFNKVQYVSTGSKEFEVKFAVARESVYKQSPFLYYLSNSVGFQRVRNFPAIAAMGAVGRGSLITFYNLDDLDNEWVTEDDIECVILHEMLHIVYRHLSYMEKDNAQLWNFSQDFVINHRIPKLFNRYAELMRVNNEFTNELRQRLKDELNVDMDKKIEDSKLLEKVNIISKECQKKYAKKEVLFASCIYPKIQDVPGIKDRDFNTLSSEYVFWCLYKDAESKGNVQQLYTDDHSMLSGEEDKDLVDAIYKKALKDATKQTRESQVSGNDKMWGSVAGEEIKKVVGLVQSKLNYKQILTNFAKNVADKSVQKTWIKPSRRYRNQSPGRMRQRLPHVLWAADTSGSMWSDDVLDNMKGQLSQLLSVCETVTVVMGDVRETFRGDARKDKNILNRLTFSGGGGTDLQFMWDAAKQLRVDGVICNTDGYFDKPDLYGIPSVFMIYPNGVHFMPEKYINVNIDQCV